MDRSVLKLKINLQNFSAIVVATTLWEHEEVKPKIREYFEDSKINPKKSPMNPEWKDVVKIVSDHINLLCLPEELSTLLQDIIIPIGEKIFYWNLYVLRNLDLLHEYTYKIYWTQFGTIDESKIFQLNWAPISEEGLGRIIKRNNDLDIFFLACLFYQKNYIKKHFELMALETEWFLAPVRISASRCSTHTLVVIWLCAWFTTNKPDALKMYKKIKNSDTSNIDLFFLCVDNAVLKAAIYFWNRLSETDKEKVVVTGAEKCLANFDKVECFEEKSIEIFIFLINNMNPDIRKNFLTKNIVTVFRLFCNMWPFQEMFGEIVDKIANDIHLDQVRFLLSFIVSCILDGFKTERYINKNIWRRMLPIIYNKLSEENKISLVTSTESFPLAIFDKFDIAMLTMILTDEALSPYKEKLLNLGIPKFKILIKSKNFELLNTLLQNVFASKFERKEFKLKINILPDLILEGNYELADEVLNWVSNSKDERILIRKQTDLIKICYEFKNCELIDEFLSWLYDREEERKNAKQVMKENKLFICDKIVTIWNENDKTGEDKCMEFLKWLLESEEAAIKLKKKLIINEDLIKKYCNTLPSVESFRRINDFLQFLSLTPEKILEIKENIIENIDNWINTYILTQKNFKMADEIVTWVFENESQKKGVIKNYFNSSEGAIFLMKAYLACAENHKEQLSLILNVWVKSYGNVNRMIKTFDKIKAGGYKAYNYLFAIKSMVNLLKVLQAQGVVSEFLINQQLFGTQ